MHEQFTGYKAFAAYLAEQGWLTEEGKRAIDGACAVFEGTQRRVGVEAAKSAMIKACDKVR